MKAMLAAIVATVLSIFSGHQAATHSAANAAAAIAGGAPSAIVVSTSSTNTAPASDIAATTTIVNQYITQPIIERTVQTVAAPTGGYVTENELSKRLAALSDAFARTMYGTTYPAPATSYASGGVWNSMALMGRIDNLANVTVSNPTITGGSISGASITGTISAAISSALATIDNLTTTELVAVNATTTNLYAARASIVTASTTNLVVYGTATSSFAGGVTATALNLTGSATSTAANGFNIAAGCFSVNGTCITGGGGAASWGSITGTLSGQADLQSALDAKLSLSIWYATTTDALHEGGINQYFTNSRAVTALTGQNISLLTNNANYITLGSLSGTYPISYDAGTGAISTVATSSLGLTASSFASPNISQWTNNAGYLTSLAGAASSTLLSDANTFSGVNSFTNAASNFGGTFGGYSVSQLIAASFSTTSAAYWKTQNDFFATTSADYYLSQKTTDNLAQGMTNKYYSTLLFANDLAGTTTDALHEGSSNLYFTNNRVASAIAGTTTTALAEGNNLYFTNARADARINATSTIGTLTSAPALGAVSTELTGFLKATAGVLSTALVDLANNVTGILPAGNGGTGWSNLASGAVLLGNGTGAVSTTTRGSLSETGSSVLTITGGMNAVLGSGATIQVAQANGSTSGFLSSGDWTTFNGKQAALGFTPAPNTRNFATTYPLQGGGDLSADRMLSLAFGTTTANTWSSLQQFANASTSLFSAYGPANFGASATSSFSSAGILSLVPNGLTVGTNQLVVTGGNVGIGTTTPQTALSVSSDAAASLLTLDRNSSGTRKAVINFSQQGVSRWQIGNDLNDANAQNFFIYDVAAGATRMLIDPSGRVGIGTASPDALLTFQDAGAADIAFKNSGGTTKAYMGLSGIDGGAITDELRIRGDAGILFSVGGTQRARIDTSGNLTVYGSGTTCVIGSGTGSTNCTSDSRLKTNITPISGADALAGLAKVSGVTFNWADPSKDQQQEIGVIAQDVQKAFPQLIETATTTFNGVQGNYLTVDYAALVSPLISAVNELYRELTKLADTVAGFAQRFTTHELCVDDVCVTRDQFAAMVAKSSASSSGSPSSPSAGSGTSSTTVNTPPVISINGSNPAQINVGDSYADPGVTISGPQDDLNLGIKTFLNGALVSNIVLDTSADSPGAC